MNELTGNKGIWHVEIGYRAISLIVLISLISFALSAQTQKKKDLENQKQELQKDIEYKTKLLDEVRKNKNRSMIQLAILNNKIASQQALISTINKELNLLEGINKEALSEASFMANEIFS